MIHIFFLLFVTVSAQQTAFDNFVPLFRSFRDVNLKLFGHTSENVEHIKLIKKLNKLQPQISSLTQFPCSLNNTRSDTVPKSVHKLRPGDIDVTAAMGDSLTCGTGLMATNLLELFIENRGISFSGGGQGSWRHFMTLPNILKEFNPSLKGYSIGDSYTHNRNVSNLNVCESGAMSHDMPYMAKFLVKRMYEDLKSDVKTHWKLITLLIGPNDFCSKLCYVPNPEEQIIKHKRDLRNVFRIIREHLPRTLLNLIVSLDVTILTKNARRNRPPQCYYTHHVECSCLFGETSKNFHKEIAQIVKMWQDAEMEVANEKEFDRDDFTVAVQTFATGTEFPKTREGFSDFTYLSYDCFHLSQKMNANVATSLWNNLLSPIGKKSLGLAKNIFDLKCPTEEHPYLFTRRNSN